MTSAPSAHFRHGGRVAAVPLMFWMCLVCSASLAEGKQREKPPRLEWLVLERIGARDETGPPLLLCVSDAARRAAQRRLGRDVARSGRLAPAEMSRLQADLAERGVWPPKANPPRGVGKDFRLILGGRNAATVYTLPADQARDVAAAMRGRLGGNEQASRVIADFLALYGWK